MVNDHNWADQPDDNDRDENACRRCGSPRVSSEKLTDGSRVYSCADCSGVTFEEAPMPTREAATLSLARMDLSPLDVEAGKARLWAELDALDDRELHIEPYSPAEAARLGADESEEA